MDDKRNAVQIHNKVPLLYVLSIEDLYINI